MAASPQPPQEQRRSPRAASHLLARYQRHGPTGAGWCVSPLRDLSSGGARFLSERPFAVGELFKLQLLLPNTPEPIWVMTRVAWVKPTVMGMQELGVAFDAGDAAIQRLIDEAVAHELSGPRGG